MAADVATKEDPYRRPAVGDVVAIPKDYPLTIALAPGQKVIHAPLGFHGNVLEMQREPGPSSAGIGFCMKCSVIESRALMAILAVMRERGTAAGEADMIFVPWIATAPTNPSLRPVVVRRTIHPRHG